MTRHLSLDELQDGLAAIGQAPKDHGVLEAIVIRPETDERVTLQHCQISPEQGVHGDNWAKGCWLSLPDGSPHPDVQVAMTNTRALARIASERDRWSFAGDNLYVDLDLSEDNLQCGQKLAIGSAVLEITAVPHNGCKKFAARYGTDALKFVNSPEGKKLHLRGIYAKIVQAGMIRVGDKVIKM